MPRILYQKLIVSHLLLLKNSILIICLILSHHVVASIDEGFPGRQLYPKIKVLSIEQLNNKIIDREVVVIDVRSRYEFQTLKILNAINIPVAEKTFPNKLKKLRQSTTKDIVFYCNGRSCYKSYKASMKALNYKIENCYTYDAGIFEWAIAHPEKASLLGHSPIKKENIITKKEFKAHLLSLQEFSKKSMMKKAMIYDVRDREQRRGGSGLFAFRDKHVDLDNIKKIKKIIAKAIKNKKTLFFYDQTGKQVRWLQYTLKAQGLKNYYFMKGGAGAFYLNLQKEQNKES
jgi:rhodanese-related sulfurtransferase